MTELQTIEPGERAISFIVEGDGPVALVLIPEPGRDALEVVGHYLAEEAGFHIIRVSGLADASVDEQVEDVLAVVDHLDLDHVWIGGHGTGGTVARVAVASHPERANGLLLLGVEDRDIPLAPVLPVLIVQGSADEVTVPAAGLALQATAPERASVKTLEGAGHLFPLTHAVETAVIIEEYLDWD